MMAPSFLEEILDDIPYENGLYLCDCMRYNNLYDE